MVKGAADNGVLPRLQHDVAAHKLLHRSLAVGQQAAQSQLVAAAERSAEHHDAQVQQVAVGGVRAPGEEVGELGLRSGEERRGRGGTRRWLYLLPSWKRANSRAVLSSTVRAVTVTGPLALQGKQPCSRTSCQSEWILQMSTESKYLRRKKKKVESFVEDSQGALFVKLIIHIFPQLHKKTCCFTMSSVYLHHHQLVPRANKTINPF